MLVELAALLARPLEETLARIRIDGLEHVRSAMHQHGRVLLLTAHLGNWELLPVACHLAAYRLSVVLRPLDAPWLDRLATRLRERSGVELIDKRAALRPVLRALAAGRMVGILLDQNAARREGVFVPFFGAPRVPRGAWPSWHFVQARRSCGLHSPRGRRNPPCRRRACLPWPPRGDLEAAIVALTARCT